ncbi:MAG TPA: hypothetical protein ENG84_04775 [Gammaproteobacteria bacterium]|nr:hypothetical protein [Gammaproteobacteria bacterium]
MSTRSAVARTSRRVERRARNGACRSGRRLVWSLLDHGVSSESWNRPMNPGNPDSIARSLIRNVAEVSTPHVARGGNAKSHGGFPHLLEKDLKAAAGHGSALAREILGVLDGSAAVSGPRSASFPGHKGARDGKPLPDGTSLSGAAELPALLARLLPGGDPRTAVRTGGAHGTEEGRTDGAGSRHGAKAGDLTRLLRVLESATRAGSSATNSSKTAGGSPGGEKGFEARLAAMLHAAGGVPDARLARLLLQPAARNPTSSTAAAGGTPPTAPVHGDGTAGAIPFATGIGPPAGPVSAPAAPPVPVPPNHPAWGEALSSRVLWVLDHQLPSASVRLNPPGLGPLEIRISLHQDQAQVSFASHHAVVRDAVEAALPRLREMLAGNGVTLAGVNISHQSLSDHGSGDTSRRGSYRDALPAVTALSGDESAFAAPGRPAAVALGLVDFYV